MTVSPVELVLSAPQTVYTGEKAVLYLTTSDGQAMPGTAISVYTPTGVEMQLFTDSRGLADFYAPAPGNYTYSVGGYTLKNSPSTMAGKAPPAPLQTAAAVVTTNSQVLSAAVSLIPLLAAIFAVAVVMLILYGFFNSRKGEAPAPKEAPAEAAAGQVYTQHYSFGDEVKQEKKIDDMTRSIISSRKKQLSDSEEKSNEEAEQAEDGAEAAAGESSENTVIGGIDSEMASLEEEARRSGERARSETEEELARFEENADMEGDDAEEEKSIEETIAELEKIREKLRSKRAQPEGEPARNLGLKAEAGWPRRKTRARRKRIFFLRRMRRSALRPRRGSWPTSPSRAQAQKAKRRSSAPAACARRSEEIP